MSVIVEVGAHTGAETFKFLQDSDATVYAFEPERHHFIELYKKAKVYPRLTVLPFAVDIGDNQEPLFHHGNGQSTLQPDMTVFGQVGFTMTWTIRLETFMQLYDIQQIDYLRIDAPYREEMCLESLGGLAHRVERGRIRRYDNYSHVPTWLYDNGFSLQLDTTSDNVEHPDIRFWRN